MLCKESYNGKERKKERKKDKTRIQEGGGRDKESEGEHKEIEDTSVKKNVCAQAESYWSECIK